MVGVGTVQGFRLGVAVGVWLGFDSPKNKMTLITARIKQLTFFPLDEISWIPHIHLCFVIDCVVDPC